MKKQKKTSVKKKSKPAEPKYTHRDSSGMSWRFHGSRPVSSLADSIMRSAGLGYPPE